MFPELGLGTEEFPEQFRNSPGTFPEHEGQDQEAHVERLIRRSTEPVIGGPTRTRRGRRRFLVLAISYFSDFLNDSV